MTTESGSDRAGELTPEERALLDRWLAPTPPADFAARALGPAPRRAPRRWPWVSAALVAAAAAVTLAAWPRAGARLGATGGVIADADGRRSVTLGARAVAVLEPGAALAYAVAAGDAYVEQRAGSVFYRVAPGRRFAVATPVGLVEVTGTCFRVEVPEMSRRPMIVSGAIGAAIATAAVVTVYEGKVRVVPSHAAPVEVGPGQAVTVGADGASVARAAAPAPVAGAPVAVALADDPAVATLSREQLIARDRAQREQIAALGQRVRELEAAPRGGRGPGLDGDFVDPSQADLAAWAKECKVMIDFPPLMAPRPFLIDPAAIKAVGLTEGEASTANATLARLKTEWAARVRAWYVEATGDAAGADALSVEAMTRELTDKALPGEPAALQKRLAEERAGLVAPPPPADLAKASPFERYFRAFADLGNEAERMLAEAIGRQSAHGVRTHEGGWPARMSMSGCDDGAQP